jgi:TonB family protein
MKKILLFLYVFIPLFAHSQLSYIPTIIGTIEINDKQAIIFSDKTWEYVDIIELKNELELSLQKTDSLRNLIYGSGDIEELIKKPDEINKRGLFQNKSDSLNKRINELILKAMHYKPKYRQMVTASLDGRSVVGALPLASYDSQNQGRVVVVVTIDQEGRVTKANARKQGSTVQDADLWKAAEEAALKACFNLKRDAPVFQSGTITYNFILK